MIYLLVNNWDVAVALAAVPFILWLMLSPRFKHIGEF